ncbi:SID1 transmembrane family member 1-like [Dreissena polymorpha]|uniref:SID1 transmembrane family member 1-like n=1 Tax=Dreissena polymorpha TaxID=45954 RepID=UPI002263E29C|nr:SID1 transmembrane family member 1-like [Dreissena polymorpha]
MATLAPFLFVFFCLCFCLEQCDGANMMSTVLMKLKESQFNTTYNGTTSLDDAIVYRYRTDRLPETVAVRISTFSSNSTTVYPVLFVVRERLNVLSWQIPLVLRDVYEYSYASRILCPVDLNRNLDQAFPEAFTVTVSSQSTVSVPFSLKADILEDFTIQIGLGSHPSKFRRQNMCCSFHSRYQVPSL